MAPPASQVPRLVKDLLGWLRKTHAPPLVASSAFHYDFEFIHPFSDGNGRMGRLWQTLLLARVETQPRTPDRILALLREQPGPVAAVAVAIDRARSMMDRAAACLQAKGRLRHVGPKRAGRWEVP